jgi:predicted MFS family arabinose efflux permease
MNDIAEVQVRVGPFARIGQLSLVAPLRIRSYRLVWFGESVSLLGDQFHLVALSWLVLGLTGSGLALGTVLLAAALPRVAFVLLGGVLSDRIPPRTLMLGSNLIRAIITTLIAGLVLGTRIEIWHLVLAGALFGTVDAIFYPAMGTIVARLVPEDRLGPANALLQGTQQLMGTVGPAVAGITIAAIGVGAAFVLDAASFAIAAGAIWLVGVTPTAGSPAVIPAPDDGPAADGPAENDALAPAAEPAHGSMAESMIEGARAVFGDPIMRTLVLLATAFNIAFTGPIVVGLPWLVQVRFVSDATLLGLFYAAFGGGSFIGVLVAGARSRTTGLGGVLLAIALVLGLAVGAIGFSPAPVVGLALFVIGVGAGYLNVALVSWVQLRTEPRLLGRTMSFMMFGSVAGAPVSLAIAGVIVDLNATALFVGAAGLMIATVVAGLASGLPRRMV